MFQQWEWGIRQHVATVCHKAYLANECLHPVDGFVCGFLVPTIDGELCVKAAKMLGCCLFYYLIVGCLLDENDG